MNEDKAKKRWEEYKTNSEGMIDLERQVPLVWDLYLAGYRAGHADGTADVTTRKSPLEGEIIHG